MTDISALITGLETASEGSRELSDRVLKVLGKWGHDSFVVPDPTRSVDAALALVPEVNKTMFMVDVFNAWWREKQELLPDERIPLALCIARLKAKQQESDNG